MTLPRTLSGRCAGFSQERELLGWGREGSELEKKSKLAGQGASNKAQASEKGLPEKWEGSLRRGSLE